MLHNCILLKTENKYDIPYNQRTKIIKTVKLNADHLKFTIYNKYILNYFQDFSSTKIKKKKKRQYYVEKFLDSCKVLLFYFLFCRIHICFTGSPDKQVYKGNI